MDYTFSPHFNGYFLGGHGLASTRMSPFWIVFGSRLMKVVVTTAAIRHTKLRSNHHNQQTSIPLFTGHMPFLSPNQQCQNSLWTL